MGAPVAARAAAFIAMRSGFPRPGRVRSEAVTAQDRNVGSSGEEPPQPAEDPGHPRPGSTLPAALEAMNPSTLLIFLDLLAVQTDPLPASRADVAHVLERKGILPG